MVMKQLINILTGFAGVRNPGLLVEFRVLQL